MKSSALLLIAAFTVLATLDARAQVDPAPLSPPPELQTRVDAEGRPLPFGPQTYRPPETPLGSGPFPAVMATLPNLPDHVLYYPADLDAAAPLPVIVWGNGACIHAGNRFRIFLTELASHGFLVMSAGNMGHIALEVGPQENPWVSVPGGPPRPPPAAPIENDPTAPWRETRSNVEHMREGIDWAVAENTRSGSRFFGRLDTDRIGAGGQSCGGGLTTRLAGDPRLDAIGIFNSGTRLQSRFGREVSDEQVATGRSRLDAVHTPTIILTGDRYLDSAYGGGEDTFNYLGDVPVFYAWQEGLTHIGTYGAPNGGSIGRIAAAWYRWWLRDDAEAARMFSGDNCLLCSDPTWHVSRKNLE